MFDPEKVTGAVVYLMSNWGNSDRYKIGCTANFRKRWNAKRFRADVLWAICIPADMNIYSAEAFVHAQFTPCREIGYGENFWMSAEDIVLFRSLKLTLEGVVIKGASGDKILQTL